MKKQIILEGAINRFNTTGHETFNGIHAAGIPHSGLLVQIS